MGSVAPGLGRSSSRSTRDGHEAPRLSWHAHVIARWLEAMHLLVEYFGQPFMGFGARRALGAAHERSSKKDVAALLEMNAERGTARAFSRTVRDVIDWQGQRRLFSQRASEVSVFPPIAVFWGDRDTLIPIARGEAFVASTQGVKLKVFQGCGHYAVPVVSPAPPTSAHVPKPATLPHRSSKSDRDIGRCA